MRSVFTADRYVMRDPHARTRLFLSLNRLATDLDTKRGGTDAYKRDGARPVGRLNDPDLQL